MKCNRAEKYLMDSLAEGLDAKTRQALEEHLAGCPGCRQKAAGWEELWEDLADLETDRKPVPSVRMTRRFRLALAAYEAEQEEQPQVGLAGWWAPWGSQRAIWQGAVAAGLVLVGVLLGTGITSRGSTQDGVEELRAEVETMSRAVTLSLLEHESASERLRAVSWSRRAEADEQVLAALVESARHDPNVNVRLAAVDALASYADRGQVRSRLIDALPDEESPLVQLAVLEVVAGEKGLENGELRRLLASDQLNEAVLQHFVASQPERL